MSLDADDADPMDYYEEYSEWLMANEPVWNGARLIDLLENCHRFDEFLAERSAQ